MNRSPPLSPPRLLASGLVMALVLGIALGWVRYWLGLFVLIQGGIAGALLSWAIVAWCNPGGGKGGPPHPGFPGSLAFALPWTGAFLVGAILGIGLAQPWFDPWGWLGRVMEGRATEPALGLTNAGGVVFRSFSLGATGWFWLFLNLLDALLMAVFLMVMPWGPAPSTRRDTGKRGAA